MVDVVEQRVLDSIEMFLHVRICNGKYDNDLRIRLVEVVEQMVLPHICF